MTDRIEKSEPIKEPPFGTVGGLYYPSDGSYQLAAHLGLGDEGRSAIHAELRECYVRAKQEAGEAEFEKARQQGREEVLREVLAVVAELEDAEKNLHRSMDYHVACAAMCRYDDALESLAAVLEGERDGGGPFAGINILTDERVPDGCVGILHDGELEVFRLSDGEKVGGIGTLPTNQDKKGTDDA